MSGMSVFTTKKNSKVQISALKSSEAEQKTRLVDTLLVGYVIPLRWLGSFPFEL